MAMQVGGAYRLKTVNKVISALAITEMLKDEVCKIFIQLAKEVFDLFLDERFDLALYQSLFSE